jgi:hypothetical protein
VSDPAAAQLIGERLQVGIGSCAIAQNDDRACRILMYSEPGGAVERYAPRSSA